MKSNVKLVFILFVSVLCLGFTSCGSDDDDENTNAAKAIEATYKGAISGTYPIPEVTLKVEYVSENKAKVIMNEPIAGIPFDIRCDVTVESKGSNVYHISGTTAIPNFSLGEGIPTLSLPIAIVGDITVVKILGVGARAASLNIVVGGGITFSPFPLDLDFIGTDIAD